VTDDAGLVKEIEPVLWTIRDQLQTTTERKAPKIERRARLFQ